MKYKEGSVALIIHKDKILLFLRDNIPTIPSPNSWSLPGGGLENGETPIEALKRELVEEVSYYPKKIHPLGCHKLLIKHITYVYYSFVSDAEAKKFKHGPGEGQAIKFMSLNQLQNLPLTRVLDTYRNKYYEVLTKMITTKLPPKPEELGLVPF